MPWEFHYQIRPWLQPGLYYALLEPWTDPANSRFLVTERLSLLVQLVLVTLALPVFLKMATPMGSPPASPAGRDRWWLLASIGCWWFLPSMLIRHSSEAFSSLLLVLCLGLWQRWESRAPASALGVAFGAGVLGGLAFDSRFQTALFLLGFGLTAIIGRGSEASTRRRAMAVFALGGLASAAAGLALDWWGYGQPTLTPWNYFHAQVLLGVASDFGSSPWYWYLVAVPVYTLNPMFWLWLGQAALARWKDPFDRCLLVLLCYKNAEPQKGQQGS